LKDTYNVTVHPDVLPHETIVKVEAIDADIGDNALISYSIFQDSTAQFLLNEKTGALTSNATRLKCPNACVVIVEARDHGNPPLNSRAIVYVEVEESKQAGPSFKIK
jgi:protocadherin-16/23